MRTDTIQSYSASGVSQTTVRAVFHNTSDPVYNGKLYSQVNPDGTKVSASYWKGLFLYYDYLSSSNWNYAYFSPSSTSGTWVSTYLTGTSTQQDPSAVLYQNDGVTGGMAIDPVWMTPYRSYRRQTITDLNGNLAYDVNELFTGSGFQIISWRSKGYSWDGLLLTDQDSTGSLTTYSYYDGQLQYRVNPDGTQTEYYFDALLRVTAAEQMSAGASGSFPAQNAINTIYTYDGASHVLTTSRQTPGGGLALSTASSYNLAGLPVSQTDTTGLVTSLVYSNGARTVTTTLPNGSTRVTDKHLDGSAKSITGNAQVNQFMSSAVNGDGTTTTTTNLGSSGSSRWSAVQTDWLGRTISQTQPAFGGGTFTKQSVYNTLGQMAKTTQTGMSATLYQYDGLGQLQYAGLDVNNNGQLDLGGTDRITETRSQVYVDSNNVWWNRTQTSVFNVMNSSTPVLKSDVRQKLVPYASTPSDYSNGVKITETDSYDFFGNLTTEVVNCNRYTLVTTDTTTLPNSSVPAVKTSYHGLLESTQTPQNVVTTYQYDGLDREVSEVDPRKGTSYTTYFTSVTGSNGHISSRTDAGGNATSYTYDTTDGRLSSQTDPMGNTVYHAYDHVGREIKTWGTGTYPVEYAFDPYGSQIAMRTFRSASINFSGTTWPLNDDGGDPQNPSPSSWASGDTTTWTFDGPTGLLTSKADASGQSVSYTYNPNGTLAKRTWARGVTTTYSYDPNTAEQIGISYSDGTPGLAYTYDRLGHGSSVVQTYSGFTLTSGLTYNVPGKLTQETLDSTYFSGRQLVYELDTTDAGKLGRTIGYEMGTSSNPGLDQAVSFGYDTVARSNSVGLSGGSTFSYAFASNSNLIGSITDLADSWSQTRTWDPHRDLLDTIQTSAGGAVSIQTFTNSGTFTVPAGVTSVQVLVVAGGGGGGTGGGGGGGVIYNAAYSVTPLAGIPVTVGSGGAAGGGGSSLDGTNGANSVFGTITAIGGGGGGGISTTAPSGGSGGGSRGSGGSLTYGGAGTSGQGTAGGNSTNDAPPYPGGGGGGAATVGSSNSGTSSGAGGNGYSSIISGSSQTYGGGGGGAGYGTVAQGGVGGAGGAGGGGAGTFTGAGGVAGAANTGGGGGGGGPYPAAGGAGGSGIVIVQWGPVPTADSFSYAYDSLGRRTTKLETGSLFARYPAGGVVDAYTYDPLSQLLKDQAYQSNNPSNLTPPVLGREFSYTYDPIGNRTTSSVDSNQFTYTSNALNQITSRIVPGFYAVSGLAPTGATVTLNGTAIPSGQIDGQYYLQNVTANNSSAPQWLTANVSSSLGGSITANSFVPQSPESSTYDVDGNILTDGRWNYFWDAENRLKAIETYGNQSGNSKGVWNSGVPLVHIDFKYDYKNRRISKIVSNWNGSAFVEASETRYAYENWNLVADYSVSGSTLSLAHSYVWGIDLSGKRYGAGGVGGLLAMVAASGSVEIPIYDANGNIHGLTDRITGQVTAAYEYSPYGELLRATGAYAQVNPFQFSSKYTDIETGFVYYGKRYYNPALGRFLGRDPKAEKGGLHLYGFVANNSVNRWDRLGMDPSSNPQSPMQAAYNAMTPLQQEAFQQAQWYNSRYGHYNSGMGAMSGFFTPNAGYDDTSGEMLAMQSSSNSMSAAQNPNDPRFSTSNSQTKTYTYQGVQYTVTNDPNAMAPSGTVSYNVSAGGAVPIGFTSNGPIISLGIVGGEDDPETIANAAGPCPLGNPAYMTAEQLRASMAGNSNSSNSQRVLLGAIISNINSSGLGGNLITAANAVDTATEYASWVAAAVYAAPVLGAGTVNAGVAVVEAAQGAANTALANVAIRLGSVTGQMIEYSETLAMEAETVEVSGQQMTIVAGDEAATAGEAITAPGAPPVPGPD